VLRLEAFVHLRDRADDPSSFYIHHKQVEDFKPTKSKGRVDKIEFCPFEAEGPTFDLKDQLLTQVSFDLKVRLLT
jgi:hypothetical protein